MSPTTKITSRQRPVFFFSEWWKGQEWSWNLIRLARWLCSIYTAAVSINCPWYLSHVDFDSKHYSSFLCILSVYSLLKLYDYITTMRYSKNELSTRNILYSLIKICHITPLPPHNNHLSTTANICIMPQGGHCRKVQLYNNFFLWVDKPQICRGYYTVARRYEFYFGVAKQYFTNERSEWVKYRFCHEKIKFISSSRRVMFFLLYRQKRHR